jgi:phenylacetate-CoA ligase
MYGKDICTLFVEINADANAYNMEAAIQSAFKSKIGITVNVKPVAIGDLPRSEKKSTRVFDNRY